MINILIEGMTDNKGGKETYIMNLFRHLDKEKYSIAFVSYDDHIAYEEILQNEGAKIIHIPPRCRGLIQYRRAINQVLKSNSFDVVWAHKTTLSSCEILDIAKKNNIPVRIVHSHSSSNMGGKFTYLMHNINKHLIYCWANEYLACSHSASEWFYGKHLSKIMVNGIDLEKFKYNLEIREKIRKELNIENKLVIGHVGRFGIEKKHKKLINIFKFCKEQNSNVKLILCGDGEERKNIELKIRQLDLQNDVILLGSIDNVHEILQAMDILVMPSLFEGLPFALLEAQASGLKCVVSDSVSRESDVMGWNQFLPLALDDAKWANQILNEDLNYDRITGYIEMKMKGFDIKESSESVRKFLTDIYNKVIDEKAIKRKK